jgi:serine phosphatase RsbU (regulator of sigma subunit)
MPLESWNRPRIGVLRAESRYLAVAAEAQAGGDICDVVGTRFGARLLIGDVMGNGLPAMELAADLLGAFRELTPHEETLAGVAGRMDCVARGDRFATAILAGFPEGADAAELVICGHPAPYLLRGDQATFVDVLPPAPPLGLLDLADEWCAATEVPLRPGDRLLFYTDGVTEARDSQGRFFELADHLTALAADGAEPLLDGLVGRLRRHIGGRPTDDVAMMLVQYCPQPAVGPYQWTRSGGHRG